MAQHYSSFSDNALTTLESLVLECQLENARQHQEKLDRLPSRNNNKSHSSTNSTENNKNDSKSQQQQHHHEMPFEDHQYIAALPGNDQCVDCRGPDVEWASVTYGVLLCTECSGIHRSLGTHVSRIRSIKMDSWTEAHIQAMRLGGNKRCRDYLEEHGKLNLAMCSIRERYEDNSAQTYHQDLKKLVIANSIIQKEAATTSTLVASKSTSSLTPTKNPAKTSTPTPARTTPNKRFSRLTASKSPNRTPVRHHSSSGSRGKSPKKTFSASTPTIAYMGRTFQADDPFAESAADEGRLRISAADDTDLLKKLEFLWYRDVEDCNLSSTHSYASTSMNSSTTSNQSASWFSASSGRGGANPSNAELSVQDLLSLQSDPDMKQYVRHKLAQQWNSLQSIAKSGVSPAKNM